MKKYLKVMLVLVVALSMLCTFALAVQDDNPFNDYTTPANGDGVSGAINSIGGTIISIIQTVGYVVAVVMVLVLGIQWLIGTPAKKQELKGKMWNVLIGAVLIIAGVSILGVVAKFADSTAEALESTSLTIKA